MAVITIAVGVRHDSGVVDVTRGDMPLTAEAIVVMLRSLSLLLRLFISFCTL
jgi:hypothetical protein